MLLRSIYLQNFRSYAHVKLDFNDMLTFVVGPNTAGKTNLSEAIYLLCTGKSFKTSSDADMIAFGKDVARVGGLFQESRIMNYELSSKNVILNESEESQSTKKDPSTLLTSVSPLVRGFAQDDNDNVKAEVMIAKGEATGGRLSKKFSVNGVAKSRATFATLLPIVLFRPEELEIVIDGPSLRREFLDSVLEQVDKEYARSHVIYYKALRQRNALLDVVKENPSIRFAHSGKIHDQFEYWDNLLIEHGQLLTQKREEFIQFLNESVKEIFDFQLSYDHSKISRERLDQYKDAEIGAGNTLVGPHRDDFTVFMKVAPSTDSEATVDLKDFGSRGQQRLVVLQLKLLQIAYIQKLLGTDPLLVLDDIFSELDSGHITLVLEKVQGCQIILTTTHKEFVGKQTGDFGMIELGRETLDY